MIPIEQQQWLLNQFYENYFNGRIKKSGDDLNFRCPFCGDSKKNKMKMRGHLSISKGVFHCFNCGHSCGGFELIAQLRNIDIKEVKKDYLKYSRKELGNSIKESVEQINEYSGAPKTNNKIEAVDILPTWTELTEDCLKYLNGRYIFDAPGWDKKNVLYYDTESDRIVFPWRNKNKIEYYQLRALRCYQNPKYLFPKGMQKQIFGLDKIDETIPFICFCEGILDSIWVKNCVAVGGIFPTSNQMKKINAKNISGDIIWFSDNFWIDESAQKEIIKKCKEFPRMKIFNWPSNCKYKDINEWICADKDFNKFWNEDFIKKNSVTLAQAKLIISFKKH